MPPQLGGVTSESCRTFNSQTLKPRQALGEPELKPESIPKASWLQGQSEGMTQCCLHFSDLGVLTTTGGESHPYLLGISPQSCHCPWTQVAPRGHIFCCLRSKKELVLAETGLRAGAPHWRDGWAGVLTRVRPVSTQSCCM